MIYRDLGALGAFALVYVAVMILYFIFDNVLKGQVSGIPRALMSVAASAITSALIVHFAFEYPDERSGFFRALILAVIVALVAAVFRAIQAEKIKRD